METQPPLTIPKRWIDKEAYEEQEGTKRQQGPKRIEKLF